MNASSDPRRAMLDREGLFAPLSAAERDLLAPRLVRRDFAADEVIVRQGETGDSLFLIFQGHLSAMFAAPGRPEREAGQLDPDDYFGEMSLLTGAPRSATVRARTAGVVFEVAKPDLAPILEARPGIAAELGLLLSRRQSVLDAIVAEHPELDRSDTAGIGATIARWIIAGYALAPGSVI